jgi:hypothetical protein
MPSLCVAGLCPVVARTCVLVNGVLDRGAQASARGGARRASQVLDRGAQADARSTAQLLGRGTQAVARGAARCVSQACVHLSWCPGPCPRRRSFCVAGT